MTGKIICLGLGPGDPELMSVKSHRILTSARQVAWFRKAGRAGQARRMVQGLIHEDARELPMDYPVTTEIPLSDPRYNALLSAFYDDWTTRLSDLARNGDVVVLCEGDPFFYGSFMHLYTRLPRELVEVVPGIPGMVGCWTASGQPITWGDDILTVLPATLPEEALARRLAETDAAVVMKIGRNLPKLVRALHSAGKYDRAVLVEYGTMPEERLRPLSEVTGDVPYFSIVLIHGQGRRP
ncbi:precorrin-2 C(20)-methyltransferase [Falsigemmobacter intermedius]|uniref:Precorrin-2 C(20)-methyltransferase n=1 Tax=Falsigemmobacter intermedius TaxID=1553448 RepID=A0A444M8M6_9RHOB|nr:precorrin-2 C(20)-methyltransferase [Falsigemmobacter intermedius]RWY38816.1 precorrin-2 C(20)-methyltransferase [Falsigemmobacter intermedius]